MRILNIRGVRYLDKLKELKNRCLAYLEEKNDKQKKNIIAVLCVVLVSLVLFGIVPNVQAHIREKQLHSLVNEALSNNDKFKVLNYSELTKKIAENKEITLLVVNPNGKNYEEMKKLINEPSGKENMTEKVFVYPVVYNKDKIDKFFNLTSDIVLFKFMNQKEVKRINFDTRDEIELYFMDYLESFNEGKKTTETKKKEKETSKEASQSEESKETTETSTTSSTVETTSQESEELDIIDELLPTSSSSTVAE